MFFFEESSNSPRIDDICNDYFLFAEVNLVSFAKSAIRHTSMMKIFIAFD